MHYNLKLSPLAAGLSLIIASSAYAAEPVQLQNASLQKLQQQFRLALPGTPQALVSSDDDSLQYLQQHTDKNHVNHVRMQQQYAGFNVIGGYAIIHSSNPANSLLAAKGKVSMNGKVYSGLKTELGKPAADFAKKGDAALNQFKAQYNASDVSEEQVTPVVYIDKQNQAHWAYKVSVYVRYDDRIPERPSAILDADTLKPFVQWNDIKTARSPVKGKGFGGNSKVGEVGYGRDLPLLEITRSKLASKCYMENKEVRVVDMEHNYYSLNKPMSFSCKKSEGDNVYWTGYKGDGYDRDNGAYSPTNDAMYAGYVIKHMYHDWYGVEALKKKDGSPMQLVMRVHYGQGYENAYWDGKQMTFGDGDTFMYPLVSLGVGSHEVSHGFTEQHSGLEYYGQSGGMNESFSDMAAMAAEFYSVGKSSWMIGAEIMKEDSGWETLRYMDVPSKDGMSIDSADEYDSSLDVHFSSGVYNRLYYTLSNLSGWDPKKAFDVMVKANMDYWTPYETFDEGGCGMISAAKDLGYSVDDIKKSLGVVAINYNSCS
ncbi:zinc metalloproteinase precursor [Legionella birminghamensis]|uniref:Neutral metalloproteinase n=3 Tax=Legionella TaxID=445 RepID=A0A378IBY6_9GAMM|nr:M4 family metallopeptidase [Legionella birminghamensis]KTC75502.1 zinc metalloproteinase precursor [Legionella birminghamensis]STX32728.1 zinc metalloprotease [Legionella birminghamensis]